MNRHLFTLAFLLGALGIIWVGVGFIDSSFIALAMTALIGAVYGFGALELRQYRQATTTLSAALTSIPDDLPSLDDWLARVHPSLQNAVRLRIEGERTGLPGPSLTPYLVGLLVMLGMLGTFLGMIITLKGAVFALDKTTDLQAIRAALAVPVSGLGLAFGTSVAGVTASAMLGLMSALSRRDRMLAALLLDTRIAGALRRFSLGHQRQETFKALQLQSEALPAVVDKLQAMMAQMEGMSRDLNQSLLGNQQDFHSNVKTVYTDLARAVDQSLRESLRQGAQAAGESIKPVVETAMKEIAQDTRLMHERVAGVAQAQLDALSARFGETTASMAGSWTAALKNQEQANAGLLAEMARSMEGSNANFEQRAAALVTVLGDAYAKLQAAEAERDAQRQQAWAQSLEAMAAGLAQELRHTGAHTLAQQQDICNILSRTTQDITDMAQASARDTLTETTRLVTSAEDLIRSRIASETQWVEQHRERMDQLAGMLRSELSALREEETRRGQAALEQLRQFQAELAAQMQAGAREALADTARLVESAEELMGSRIAAEAQWTEQHRERMDQLAGLLRSELSALRDEETARGQAALERLQQFQTDLAAQLQAGTRDALADTARLVESAEELMRSRIAAEAQWMEQHRERMNDLAGMLRAELGTLRDEENARGNAAVERLAQLETTVTAHLTMLGTALEAPIARLVETASEAPRAAAEVIGQLRQEISNSVARDNAVLEERSRIMETLNALLEAINHASLEQRAAIDSLVTSSEKALHATAAAFSDNVSAEAAKLSDIAASVTSSAVDVASLSDAFGFAVNAFNEANDKLIASLQRIEGAMDKSQSRSDEQLAYYVAQAREIIDLSMMSQKEVVEALRRLPVQQAVLADEVK